MRWAGEKKMGNFNLQSALPSLNTNQVLTNNAICHIAFFRNCKGLYGIKEWREHSFLHMRRFIACICR